MTPISAPPPETPARTLRPVATGGALWALGFRPFYLLASLFGALSVPLWAAQFSGLLPFAYLRGSSWHAHEMLFGYTLAVIAGFLLTAVRAWTGQATATGAPLMALAVLWVCGRVLVLTPLADAAAVANTAFPVALALAIGIPLWRARNARNYFFIGLLALMAVLAATAHLAPPRWPDLAPQTSLRLGLDVVLFIMAVMGGRVIPMFTNNGVPGADATRHALVEKAALGSLLLLFTTDLLRLPAPVSAALLVAATLAHGARLALWKPWRTRGNPMVWILHAAYAWIVLHLALRGLQEMGLLAGTPATHALTVGAIGGLTLGMMTRTARGHTGRTLLADNGEAAIFIMIQLAALARVFGALVAPALFMPGVLLGALLWSGACGLYAVRYWPVLTRPRLDGKPG